MFFILNIRPLHHLYIIYLELYNRWMNVHSFTIYLRNPLEHWTSLCNNMIQYNLKRIIIQIQILYFLECAFNSYTAVHEFSLKLFERKFLSVVYMHIEIFLLFQIQNFHWAYFFKMISFWWPLIRVYIRNKQSIVLRGGVTLQGNSRGPAGGA